MTLLNIQEVKKFYGKQDVLKGVSFYVGEGDRVGLIGANGAGKTTLLRVILGNVTPDEGQVHLAKGLRIGYLPQDLMTFSGRTLLDLVMDTADDLRAIEAELEFIRQDIEQMAGEEPRDEEALIELAERQGRLQELFENLGGYTLEAEAKKILLGLGFSEGDFSRLIDEFSGGWTMRAVLARLLLAGPDILLLDEPTNHLDMDSLLWLEDYLLRCPSALMLVSHDRVFLNNVVRRIVEVERGRVFSYQGNYDQYLVDKEKRRATEAAAYASQQDRIKQAERFIERNRVRASTARRAQSKIKMLDKMERLEAPTEQKTAFNLILPKITRSPDTLVSLSGINKAYGRNVVYRDLDFSARRGDRIAFLGANGRGKSTLMKLLAGLTDYQGGERRVGEGVVLSYFAQFQLEELNPEATLLEELSSVAGDLSPGRLRSILGAFLFRGDDVFKKVSVLSGGERSRLLLAKIMIVGPNLLLLDEPTNHLDIPGRDVLERALRQYTGTICLISHDRRLINAVANKVLVIHPGGGVEVFPGNFDDYQEIWRERLAMSASSRQEECTPESPSLVQSSEVGRETRAEREARKKAEAEARQRLHSQRAPLVKEIEHLEEQQLKIAERLDEISAELAEPDTYQDSKRTKELNLEYARIKDEMDSVTAAWELAALQLEEIENEITCTN